MKKNRSKTCKAIESAWQHKNGPREGILGNRGGQRSHNAQDTHSLRARGQRTEQVSRGEKKMGLTVYLLQKVDTYGAETLRLSSKSWNREQGNPRNEEGTRTAK